MTDALANVTHVSLVLRGGLGNQLFQYAAARRLLQGAPSAGLTLLSYGNEWGPDHPDLASLLGVPITYPNRVARSTIPSIAIRESWKDPISAVLARLVGAVRGTAVVKQADPYGPFVLPHGRRFVLDGFFQNREWWGPVWHEVAKAIHHSEPAAVAQLRRERRSVVKLRRSDYLGRGIVLNDEYYRDALAALEIRDQEVTVICEDLDAMSSFDRLLSEFGCTLRAPEPITGNVNIDDFWHMAAADRQILANSSYSWWAAAVAQVAGATARAAYPVPWLPNTWSDTAMPDMGMERWVSIPAGFV